MHIKSSFPLLPCFEVGSIFFSTLNIPLFQQLEAKRWQQDVAEGEDDFWEVRSCALGPGCFKSLSKRIACVELGSNRSSDGLILVKAGKWPFLLREG